MRKRVLAEIAASPELATLLSALSSGALLRRVGGAFVTFSRTQDGWLCSSGCLLDFKLTKGTCCGGRCPHLVAFKHGVET